MYYTQYCNNLISFPRLFGKLVGKNQFYNKNNILNIFNMKSLEITLRIPSKISYEHGFIAMLMLTEKMSNGKVIFLLDKNTLSKKRTIKVGAVITIKNEMIDLFLKLCCDYSVPKFYSEGIFFHMSYKNNPIAYKLNKILSNTLFSFDKDVNSYYDYLGELEYDIDFLFRTHFKNELMNKLLISNKGISFINELNVTSINSIKEGEERSLIEEFELDIEMKKEEDKIENEIENEMKQLNELEIKEEEERIILDEKEETEIEIKEENEDMFDREEDIIIELKEKYE